MSRIWAGIDSGKGHHHGLALDAEGKTLLSRRVANDEPELLKLIGDVLDLADGREVTWAIDMTGGEPALLLALLVNHGQEVLYIPGRLVNRASDGYRGEGKTDARDAYVIADQARMRRDLRPIRPGDEAAVELKLLTGRRADLAEDRTRVVNRLRGTLLSMFPALERVLEVTNTGPLRLLTGYQTPAAIRRTGIARLTKWLANRKVRNARALAETAVEAAERQHTAVPGEKTIAKLVHTLAEEVMALNEQISETDKLIEGRFREHELADIVESVPGIGTILGAEFLAACRRQPGRLRLPGRLGGLRRRRARAPRLGQGQRQSPPAGHLSPQTPARLLHFRAGQRPLRPELTQVLRPQTRRGEETRPGRARPRPPTRQRPVGSDP